MAEQKTYVPRSSAKKVEFQNGGSLMKVSFHAETVAEFLRANANEKGYCNMIISERREPDKYGNTHSVALDTWKPTAQVTKPSDDDNPY